MSLTRETTPPSLLGKFGRNSSRMEFAPTTLLPVSLLSTESSEIGLQKGQRQSLPEQRTLDTLATIHTAYHGHRIQVWQIHSYRDSYQDSFPQLAQLDHQHWEEVLLPMTLVLEQRPNQKMMVMKVFSSEEVEHLLKLFNLSYWKKMKFKKQKALEF